jgi:hypothetical protein
VDERVLRDHISQLLRSQPQVTLAEVTRAFPPEQGLAEVVAYLRIAAHEGAPVDEAVSEKILIPGTPGKAGKNVRVPRVIFTR